jgi:hypothetical protein
MRIGPKHRDVRSNLFDGGSHKAVAMGKDIFIQGKKVEIVRES